jgi:hypothetical protein
MIVSKNIYIVSNIDGPMRLFWSEHYFCVVHNPSIQFNFLADIIVKIIRANLHVKTYCMWVKIGVLGSLIYMSKLTACGLKNRGIRVFSCHH